MRKGDAVTPVKMRQKLDLERFEPDCRTAAPEAWTLH